MAALSQQLLVLGGSLIEAPRTPRKRMWKHGLRSSKGIERRRAMTAAMRAIGRALAKA